MAGKDKIRRVKVDCPLKGESHEGKWVERRETIGIPVYREISGLSNYFTDEEALKRICEIFSELIVDWDLEDDEGKGLPKPYRNPEAFEKLAEVDSDAFIWIVGVVGSTIDSLVEPAKKAS